MLASAALVFAMLGTAVAGPGALTHKLTKAKVRTIARKQAAREISARAPSLTVAEAATATSADPRVFAHLSATGVLDAAGSKGVTAANVIAGAKPGYTCFSELGFDPRGAVATIDFNGGKIDTIALTGLGPGPECPPGTQLFVDTRNTDGTGSVSTAVFIVIYR